jgi:hypothetical protein
MCRWKLTFFLHHKFISAINKPIRFLPEYGLAFAKKLELYIIAIEKAFDEAEKLGYKTELHKVFKNIANNRSTTLCSKIIKRINNDRSSFPDAYISILYKDYPNEMAEIEKRASDVLPTEEKAISSNL